MMRTNHLLLLACVALIGCNFIQLIPQKNAQLHEMSDWPFFSIQSSTVFRKHIVRDDGSVALTTYDTGTTQRSPNDYSVHLYPSLSASCSSSDIGVNMPVVENSKEGTVLVKGRVDFPLDYELTPLTPDCRPYKPDAASYIFCSEKNGRKVAICIFQITDNPELAEQIFRTFRWTD